MNAKNEEVIVLRINLVATVEAHGKESRQVTLNSHIVEPLAISPRMLADAQAIASAVEKLWERSKADGSAVA